MSRGAPSVLGTLAVLLLAGCGGEGGRTIVDPPTPPAISTLALVLDSIRAANDLPALGAAIVTSRGTQQLATVGVRRYGSSIGVAAGDRWHIGSALKHQTSVLAARLVADGHLRWEATLPEHFPELAPTMRDEYRAVTLRELLSHTAGFPRDHTTGIATPREARAAVVAWALRQPPVASFGSYAYGNVNYMIASAIMERATDRPYEELIAELVWRPLGMASAGFGAAGTPGASDEPLGHTVTPSGARIVFPPEAAGADNPVEYGPAGRAHMSLADWGRFVAALLLAEQGGDTPVLTSAQWRVLTAAPFVRFGTNGYGFGMVIADRPWANGRALFHDGTNLRHYALVGVAPGRDFAILIASNQYSDAMGAIMDGIFGRLTIFHLQGR